MGLGIAVFIATILIIIPLIATNHWKFGNSGDNKSDECKWGRTNYVTSQTRVKPKTGYLYPEESGTHACHLSAIDYFTNAGVSGTSHYYWDGSTTVYGGSGVNSDGVNTIGQHCPECVEMQSFDNDAIAGLNYCRGLCDCEADCIGFSYNDPIGSFKSCLIIKIDVWDSTCTGSPMSLLAFNLDTGGAGWDVTVGPVLLPV